MADPDPEGEKDPSSPAVSATSPPTNVISSGGAASSTAAIASASNSGAASSPPHPPPSSPSLPGAKAQTPPMRQRLCLPPRRPHPARRPPAPRGHPLRQLRRHLHATSVRYVFRLGNTLASPVYGRLTTPN
ncbi:hypothetical protein ABZP36_024672 [Zizania latifolia]